VLKFKIQILVIISAIFLSGSFFVSDSYGLEVMREHYTLHEVSVQLVLRNSDGQLVAYLEPTLMYIVNIWGFHSYLDNLEYAEKTIITKDGKNLEMIKFVEYIPFTGSGQYSSYGVVVGNYQPLLFRHDGYLTQPGDELFTFWKVVRTIDR